MFDKNYFAAFTAVTCIKFLFLPLYRSTDFEVHRNWLAITNKENISNWYHENTSQWTLDYPPFFAWFEYILSHFAKYFDEKMLEVSNLNYASSQTVFFQRLTVIVSDVVYIYAINQLYKLLPNKKKGSDDPWIQREVIMAMLLLWNPGLLLIDHIHFQYNGFLNGLLILSFSRLMQEHYLEAAFWFSTLLNFKHIYLYLAPTYFIFFLKNYCFKKHGHDGSAVIRSFSIVNFLKLGIVVSGVFALSFGPFILMGQLKQVLLRLFPLKRGLTHSYWAPNFWALYNFADRVLNYAAYYSGIYKGNITPQSTVTRGLVQEYDHVILPSISPLISLFLTCLSILPALWIAWKRPKSSRLFLQSIIICSFGAFLFGWHVHEKAILLVIIPLTILAVSYREEAEACMFLSIVGHFSLFPLLHEAAETPIKILLLLLYTVYMYISLSRLHKFQNFRQKFPPLLSRFETIFLIGIPVLQMFYSFGLNILKLEDKLPFLPLMLISTYCSVGIFYVWLRFNAFLFPGKLPLINEYGGKITEKQ